MIAGTDKELKLLDKASAEFSKKELAPNREEHDNFPFSPFFEPVLKKARDLDFFHIMLPEALGGIGQGVTALSLVLYNLCREDSSLGTIVFTHTAAMETLLAAGADNLIREITSQNDTAEEPLLAFPVFNNPEEIPHMATYAVTETGYTLSGSVDYVVLATIGTHALLPARREGAQAFSFFLINMGDRGIRTGDPVHSLGVHACPAADLELDTLTATLAGKEGMGASYFNKMADRMSVAAAAMSAGIMKGACDEALAYSRGRFQGGRAIINWSEIQMILSDMIIKNTNARMLISRAGQAVDAKENGWEDSARSAAAYIQDAACDLTTWGIQVLGGVGYMKDFGQEKRFRDAQHLQALLGLAPLKKLAVIQKYLNG